MQPHQRTSFSLVHEERDQVHRPSSYLCRHCDTRPTAITWQSKQSTAQLHQPPFVLNMTTSKRQAPRPLVGPLSPSRCFSSAFHLTRQTSLVPPRVDQQPPPVRLCNFSGQAAGRMWHFATCCMCMCLGATRSAAVLSTVRSWARMRVHAVPERCVFCLASCHDWRRSWLSSFRHQHRHQWVLSLRIC